MGCRVSKKEEETRQKKAIATAESLQKTEDQLRRASAAATASAALETMGQMTLRYNQFAIKLFLSATPPAASAAMSPASFGTTLCIIMEGAAGATQTELCTLLGGGATPQQVSDYYSTLNAVLSNASEHVLCQAYNGIFIGNGIVVNDSFLEKVRKAYDANVTNVDFRDRSAAAMLVNGIICDATHGLLKDSTSPDAFTDHSGLLTINTNFFEALWKKRFKSTMTAPGTFHGLSGPRTVQFMKQEGTPYLISSAGQCTSVLMQYKDPSFNAVLVMPDHDFRQWRASLTVEKLETITGGMQLRHNADLIIPKFDIECSVNDAEGILKALGAQTLFGAGANFSALSPAHLHVSAFQHTTKIEFTETGTRAAAVTRVCYTLGIHYPSETFTFNRPFLFVVRYRDTILYLGSFV